ncbi:MAG: hypothetical protein R3F17_14335 [Planctomycetota bacterium]
MKHHLLLALSISLVSPVLAQGVWIGYDTGPQDRFGSAVAAQGPWTVAGAPREGAGAPEAGAVYLRHASTGSQFKLRSLTPLAGACFGSAVALDGDLLLVGAPGSGGALVGEVFLFEWDGSTWTQRSKWSAVGSSPGDGFGSAVAIKGDRLLVGAPGAGGTGQAQVFQWRGGRLGFEALLVSPQALPGDQFGGAVDLGARWAVVGAQGANSVVYNEGAAYVYDGANQYALDAILIEPGFQPNAFFGRSVAVDGDRIAVGATHDHNTLNAPGQVHVFERSAAWQVRASVTAPGASGVDAFGYAVDLQDGRLLVGAPLAAGSGGAWAFEPFDGAWWASLVLDLSPTTNGDFVGGSLAWGSDGAVVGAMLGRPSDSPAAPCIGPDSAAVQAPLGVAFCGCEQGPPCGGTGSAHGCPNSTGVGARLTAGGSASMAADDLTLELADAPPGSMAVLWMSGAHQHTPSGWLPLHRFRAQRAPAGQFWGRSAPRAA